MLLQGSSPTRDRGSDAPVPITSKRAGRQTVATQSNSVPVGRTYPPIVFSHPSVGRSFVEGLGGIARSTLVLILLGGAFIGLAMVIAIAVTSLVSALGFDPSGAY